MNAAQNNQQGGPGPSTEGDGTEQDPEIVIGLYNQTDDMMFWWLDIDELREVSMTRGWAGRSREGAAAAAVLDAAEAGLHAGGLRAERLHVLGLPRSLSLTSKLV